MRRIKIQGLVAALVFVCIAIWSGNSLATSGVASLGSFLVPFFLLVLTSILSGLVYAYISFRKSKKRSAWFLFPLVSIITFVSIPVVYFGGLALLSLL